MYEEETEQYGNWNYHHNTTTGKNDGGKQLLLLTSWLAEGLSRAMATRVVLNKLINIKISLNLSFEMFCTTR